MVNPIYQQDEELLLNPFGSRYLASGAYTDVNSNEFVVQEDTVISVLTGGDVSISENSIDYKASMNLSGVTLKRGALIVAPVGEAFKSITIDSGSIMAYNCVVKGEKPGSFVGLLDLYPDAAAAYSLRKLRTDYAGAAIKVRKTVDGTTSVQDIGFVDNELDTTSLLSFADGEDVFVHTWYDQSGGGSNDVAQVEASKQPQIVSNGVVVTTSGNYAVDFTSSAKYLVNETFNNLTAIGSVFTLLKSESSLGTQIVTDSTDSSARQVSGYYGAGPSVFNIFKGIVTRSQTLHNTNLNLLSTFFDVKSDLYLNGVKIIDTLNAGTNNRQGFTLGSGIDGVVPFNGSIFEVIIFDEQNKSSDRVGIETNINDYYTIYE